MCGKSFLQLHVLFKLRFSANIVQNSNNTKNQQFSSLSFHPSCLPFVFLFLIHQFSIQALKGQKQRLAELEKTAKSVPSPSHSFFVGLLYKDISRIFPVMSSYCFVVVEGTTLNQNFFLLANTSHTWFNLLKAQLKLFKSSSLGM